MGESAVPRPPRGGLTGPYARDLAYVHDVGFGDFARGAAPAVLGLLRRAGITSGRLVDLGCGSGIWAEALCRAGYDVHGIDISPAMIALARRRAPQATFSRGSFLSAKLPRCDVVTALGECINYAFDPRVGWRALPAFFRRIHEALRPGGLLVFDAAAPGRGARAATRFRAGDGWVVIARVSENVRRRTLTRHITTFRRVRRLWRRSDELHRLRLYRPADVVRSLRETGFQVRVLRGYGRTRLMSGWTGFVARRRRAVG